MSIRLIVLGIVVVFLIFYSWKNWFHALLGGIVLFAFLEHPSMPRTMLGVPGMNCWNLLFANITLAWMRQRIDEGCVWDFPGIFKFLIICFLLVCFTAFLRTYIDPGPYCLESRVSLVMNYFINTNKYLLPALLLYDGCRTRERIIMATSAILLVYFFLAFLTIRTMGLHLNFSSGDELSAKAARRLTKNVGYHRVDLSMMLAGGSLAVFAFSQLIRSIPLKCLVVLASGMIFIGQLSTGGRTGYMSWAVIALMLCLLRWRKLLPLIPVGIVIVLTLFPSVRERMFQGFGSKQGAIVVQNDSSSITSGRTKVWPKVIEQIGESPVVGYGRLAMQRTGLTHWASAVLYDVFAHPHNAYLEFLLDNGWLGFLLVMPIYIYMIYISLSMFMARGDPLFEVVGAASLALILALMLAAVGAQTFYPREGVVPMWAMFAVTLRLWVLRRNSEQHGLPMYYEEDDTRNLMYCRFITAKNQY